MPKTEREAVASSELLEALRRWRYFEKRHAATVLGELDIDLERAQMASDRALHILRIEADKFIKSEASNGEIRGGSEPSSASTG